MPIDSGELRRPTPWLPVRLASSVDPAWVAFIGSLILSLIAILASDGPNRDGMLYLDGARIFLENGLEASLGHFDWPFFLIAIALASKLTALNLEAAAYALCGLLLAGACVALVRLTVLRFPEAGWAACAIALSLPALNDYRDYVIRDFGFWLFSLLAIGLAIRWAERPMWRGAAGLHLAIATAALFRLEAVILYPALMLWLAADNTAPDRWRRISILGGVPFFGTVALVLYFSFTGWEGNASRIQYYLSALEPSGAIEGFRASAEKVALALSHFGSVDDAGWVLTIGLSSLVAVKFVKMTGALMVPLVFAFHGCPLRGVLQRWQPMGWVFAAYALVLLLFLFHNLFLVGRHVSFLCILAVPLIAAGLDRMLKQFRAWRMPILALILAIAASNVISLGPGGDQFVKAGAWLAGNVQDRSRVYVGSDRAAYHAGWPYGEVRSKSALSRESLAGAVRSGDYDLIVLESPRHKNDSLAAWVAAARVEEVIRFSNRRGDSVIVFRPMP